MAYVDGFVGPFPQQTKKNSERCVKPQRQSSRNMARSTMLNAGVSTFQTVSTHHSRWRSTRKTMKLSSWPGLSGRQKNFAMQPWEKFANDPRMQPDAMEMPFDTQRVIMGGFEPVVGL